MPVDAKGRLKYLDFLSRFGSEKVATPLATGDWAKAHRGGSVPEVTDGTRAAVPSPTGDLRAGTRARSHPCVSSPSLSVTRHLAPGHTPRVGGPLCSHRMWRLRRWHRVSVGGGQRRGVPCGPFTFTCLEGEVSVRKRVGGWKGGVAGGREEREGWRQETIDVTCAPGIISRKANASCRCHCGQSALLLSQGVLLHPSCRGRCIGSKRCPHVLGAPQSDTERPDFKPRSV